MVSEEQKQEDALISDVLAVVFGMSTMPCKPQATRELSHRFIETRLGKRALPWRLVAPTSSPSANKPQEKRHPIIFSSKDASGRFIRRSNSCGDAFKERLR